MPLPQLDTNYGVDLLGKAVKGLALKRGMLENIILEGQAQNAPELAQLAMQGKRLDIQGKEQEIETGKVNLENIKAIALLKKEMLGYEWLERIGQRMTLQDHDAWKANIDDTFTKAGLKPPPVSTSEQISAMALKNNMSPETFYEKTYKPKFLMSAEEARKEREVTVKEKTAQAALVKAGQITLKGYEPSNGKAVYESPGGKLVYEDGTPRTGTGSLLPTTQAEKSVTQYDDFKKDYLSRNPKATVQQIQKAYHENQKAPEKLTVSDVKAGYTMAVNSIKNRLMIDMTPDEQSVFANQPPENLLALLVAGRAKTLSPEKKTQYMKELRETEDYYNTLQNQVLGRKGVAPKEKSGTQDTTMNIDERIKKQYPSAKKTGKKDKSTGKDIWIVDGVEGIF